MNKIIISGNLTANPQTRLVDGASGTFSVCNFNVAVNRVVRGSKSVQYFRVSSFGKYGENAMKYLAKGSKVLVCGSVSASAYTDRNNKAQASLEVNAEYIEFMSLRHEEPQEAPAPQPSPDEFMNVPDDIGEMPFN